MFFRHHHPDQSTKKPDPFEDEAEGVAGGGEDGIDGVAMFVGEAVRVHSVAVLEVPDDLSLPETQSGR